MGVITKIEQQKNKSRVNIYVDDTFFCGLEKETAIIFGLKPSKTVDEEELKRAIFESECKRAFEKGANYLSSRMQSKKELEDKLIKKGFTKEVADKATSKLEEYGYVDDRLFAKLYAEQNSKYSKRVLEGKLKQKGIDRLIIAEVVCNIDDDTEFESCKKYAEKYVKSHDISSASGMQKLQMSLARRGFDFQIIKKVCKTVSKNCDFDADF